MQRMSKEQRDAIRKLMARIRANALRPDRVQIPKQFVPSFNGIKTTRRTVYTSAQQYVAEFDRLNNLRPADYQWAPAADSHLPEYGAGLEDVTVETVEE